MEFNRLCIDYNDRKTLISTRLSALRVLKKDEQALRSFAEYLHSHMPHWDLKKSEFMTCLKIKKCRLSKECREKSDYRICKYVLYRLSAQASETYRSGYGEFYAAVQINIKGTMAVIKKQDYRRECRVHEKKKSVGNGLCKACYQRRNRLISQGIIVSDTPEYIVNKILILPAYTKGGFTNGAKEIVHQETQ